MEVNQLLEEFKDTFLYQDFIWRKGQKEAIIEIIDAYINKTHNVVIIDAPVGSGKSIIAMAASWILNQLGHKGYILASDIALQEQYEKDFKRFNLHWGSVKGIDNYLCIDNDEKNSLGTCRIRNKIPKSFSCYNECPYFSARDFASQSQTSLLNYAYWLIQQNYVNGKSDSILFPPRDFTICDEGHKILDIVQNHYSPRFDPKTLEKLEKLTSFFVTYKVKDLWNHFYVIKDNLDKIQREENQDRLLDLLKNIELSLESYKPSIELFKTKVNEDYPKKSPPKEWRDALRLCDWLKDIHCKVEDYVDIICKTSTRNLIKNPQGKDEILFNCLEENYLMNKYFHEWTGFTVIMSATISDPRAYLNNIGLSNAKYIKMSSNFSFEKSPIYYYNQHKMSYNHIEANLPWLYETINHILDKHNNESGIIHSASYDLTMKIFNNLSRKNKQRVLVYNGTQEKREVIEILKREKNKVLLGPSLLEGLDFKDDWSRFCIFAKVPYLSLSDKFVKVKLQMKPDWYRWRAIISILQGVGRSVRSENDWAITYILDGSMGDLIHNNRSAFPIEFFQRLKIINE